MMRRAIFIFAKIWFTSHDLDGHDILKQKFLKMWHKKDDRKLHLKFD